MFENPRRGRQARNFTANVPKILDLKSSSEQIFFRKLSLGAPDSSLPASGDQIWKTLVISIKMSSIVQEVDRKRGGSRETLRASCCMLFAQLFWWGWRK